MKFINNLKITVITFCIILAILFNRLLADNNSPADTAQTTNTTNNADNSNAADNTAPATKNQTTTTTLTPSTKTPSTKTNATTTTTLTPSTTPSTTFLSPNHGSSSAITKTPAKNIITQKIDNNAKNNTTKLAAIPNQTKNNFTTNNAATNNANNNDTNDNNGWTAIVPNKIEPKDNNFEQNQNIKIADKKNTGTINQTPNNKIGVWDALPENVTKNKDTKQNKTNETNINPFAAKPNIDNTKIDNIQTDKTQLDKTQLDKTQIDKTQIDHNVAPNLTNPNLTQIIESKPLDNSPDNSPAFLPKDLGDELREPPPIKANLKTDDAENIVDEKNTQQKNSANITNSEPVKGEVKNPFKPEVINENEIETPESANAESTKSEIANPESVNSEIITTEKKSLTDVQKLTADEITKRINDLEKQKSDLEQLLKNGVEKSDAAQSEANETSKTSETNKADEPAGVASSKKITEKTIEMPAELLADEPTTKSDEVDENKEVDEDKNDKLPKSAKPAEPAEKISTDKSEAKESDDKKSDDKSETSTNKSDDAEKTGAKTDGDTETTGDETESQVEVEEAEKVLPDFDEELPDEPVKKLINPRRVGDSDGVDKLKLMYDEIINGLKSRNITGKYERWKEYARSTIRNSSGINTGSELDGRSRLNWYKKLYNEPIYSVFEAEEFTRQLHDGLRGNHRLIAETMSIIREKLDVAARNDNGIVFPKCETPIDAVNEIKRALIAAQMHHARAMSTLTSAEQTELVGNLVQTFAGNGCVNGHTIPSRTYGRRLLDMMTKIDKSAMHDAAEVFIPLLNKSLLDLLDKLPENALSSTLIGGQTFQRLVTSAGDIVIGGRGNNAYDLDSPDFRDVICIIDLGGNDSYRDGTCGLHRPVLLIIDLHGSDTYTATRPGVQGGSIMGVSVLIDVEGDDRYNAVDIAQGSSIGGIGMLFDFAGDDTYRGLRRVQAHALSGVGIIVDRDGNDDYHAAMWAQAFGAPSGFGVLEDTAGNDHYYCGGLYVDSYPEHPGYDGWGQGIGAGIRQVANGGIGVLLEGDGDDVYEVDYFGHGGGYWLGAGFARDFKGNDVRHGTTLTAYNGTNRRENKWTRFANGFGCHYSVGYCFDDEGDDVYGGTIMGTGMAWDLSMGYLCDFNGNNKFTATGGMTQGVGAEGSIGVLFTYGGNDAFSGRNQAYASGNISYHSVANCGSNFSFVINYGGTDTYGSGAKNNAYAQRGSTGGFLIDRPTSSESVVELEKLQKAIELRNKEIAEYDAKHDTLRKEAAKKGRRYYPRTKRPTPIPQEQQRILTGVPDFKKTTSTKVTSTNIEIK
ncbi:MAG: hypothetical protein LBP59_04480 [Planctomycetaceae bacterium]|jgi:hypothetical protein|nr:hypothetical protein [Planctomycetaceae bacterium]